MKAFLTGALLLLFSITVFSQSAVVSGYYNPTISPTSTQSDEWTELLVIQDNLDMRNWTLGDNNAAQTSWQTPIKFNNIAFWSHMRAGTIIIIWHRSKDSGGTNHPQDINPNDGYVELWANDVIYFTGGDFSGNSTLNIATAGDLIQLKDAGGNHVHALGHIVTVPVAGSFNAILGPKLNHTASLGSGSALFIVPGIDITYYGTLLPLSGTTYTNMATGPANSSQVSFGLPNNNTTWATQNSDFWRTTRQPGWITPSVTASPNGTFSQVNLTWNACMDPYPADGTEGFIILRNTTFSFTDPIDGVSYPTGSLIGTATVVASISPSTTTSYTDNISLPCGDNLYYRIYAYRYSADVNSNDVARGRAYNETSYASATINGPTPPSVSIAGPDQSLCGTFNTNLNANNPSTGMGIWTYISGPGTANFGNSSVNNTSVTVSNSGIYVFRWTISNGVMCPSSFDEVTVEFSNAISVNAANNSPVCTGEDILLTSSISGATYSWTGSNGFISNIQNPVITNSTLLDAGNYNITVTGIPGGCPPASSSTFVMINSSPQPPVSVNSNLLTLCSDDPGNITLTANGGSGSVIEWFTGSCGGTQIGTGINLTIPSPESTTTYYAWWNSIFCGNSVCDSVTVTVVDPPNPSNAGNDQSVCGLLSTALEGNNPLIGSGLWTLLSGPGTASFGNSSLYNSSVTVTVSGSYIFRWTISNGVTCLPSFDDVTIVFSNAIMVVASSNSPVCEGNDLQLTSSIPGATYFWTGPNGFTSTEQNPSISGATLSQSGNYTINVTGIPGGCPSTSNSTLVIIDQSPTPPVSVTSNILNLCADDPGTITLTAFGGSGGILEWTTVSCNGTSVGTGPLLTIASPAITTTYFAHWSTISCGSSTCQSVNVTVSDPPTTSNAGGDQSLCGVLTTNLNGNNPLVGSGLWTFISGPGSINFGNSSLYNTAITVSVQGIYILRWTLSNGADCQPSYDDVFIEFGNALTVNISSNSPTCIGDTIFLTSSIAGAIYSWTGPNGFTSTDQNPVIPNASATNSGSYFVIVSNIPGGCPNTSNSTSVTVNPTPVTPPISSQNVVGNSQDVCVQSLVPYQIDPATPGSIYTWNLSGGGTILNTGSPNLININWTTAGGPYILTATETTIDGCIGLPVTLNIIVYSLSTASVAIVVDNNPICTGLPVTFTATPVNGGSSPQFTWFVNGIQIGGSQTLPTYTYVPSNGDKVHVRQESSSPCASPNQVSSDTIIMLVTTTVPPTIDASTPATSLCLGDMATITTSVTNGGTSPTYSWYINGVLQTGQIADSLTFTPNDGDTVYVKLISNLGCASPNWATSQSLVFSINQNPLTGISILQDTVLCSSDPVTLKAASINAGPFPIYQWYVNNNIVPGEAGAIYSGSINNGDVVYSMVTSSLSCATGNPAKSNDISVSKPALLEITKVDTVSATCGHDNGSITITGNGGTGQIYYSIANPPEWFTNPLFDSLSASTPYTIQIKDANGCNAYKGIYMLSALPGPIVTASGGGNYCTGDSVVLSANPSTGLSYEWLYPSGNKANAQEINIPAISAADSGEYRLSVTDINTGCPDTTWVSVIVNKLPDVSFGQPPTLCAGNQYLLTPGPGYASYLWQDGSTAPDYSAIDAGIYFVRATDLAGCAGTDTVSLENCSQIYIPNAFTPNMDGTNDNFKPVASGTALLDFDMVIFNRWGQKIFESNDFLNGWDGKLNGSDVLPGLYTYLISYRLADPSNLAGSAKTKLRGTVTLVR